MLDIHFIRDNRDIVEAAIKNKKAAPVDIDRVLALYDERKELQNKEQELNRQKNEAAQRRDIDTGRMVKEELQKVSEKLQKVQKELVDLLSLIPNVPSADTPVGKDESENKVIKEVGEKPVFAFGPKAHWDLGPERGVIDIERAVRIAGARFAYLKGDLVLLQFALLQFTLDALTSPETLQKIITENGLNVAPTPFVPVLAPAMLRPEVLNAMGRLNPREDKYYLQEDNLFLAGSSEHTVGSMYMNEILKEKDLPLRYVGYSTCFRREAGTYGKDTKGILRMHQFDKIEMESFSLPEDSHEEHRFLVAVQEYLVGRLNLPYRVVHICTGDMGFPNHRQIDIETWMPGQGTYRETHTADYVGGFQPRRLNTKVERKDGTKEYLHMNDATAFAMGRILIAIMENYQQADGSIVIPEVLRKYMNGKEKLS